MQDQLETYLDRCRGLIAQHGFIVQCVGAESGDGYAYTVGLTGTLGCELITIGLPLGTANAVLNTLAARLVSGLIPDGEDIHEIASGLPVRLQTYAVMDPARGIDRSTLVALSRRLGYPVSHIRQLVWPDRHGRFPGEDGYTHPNPQSPDLLIQVPTAH